MTSPTLATQPPSDIGTVYALWTLDSLVEVGYVIAVDFINRPQLYQGDDIPEFIVTFRVEYGTNPAFANTAQRLAMMLPVFGRSDGVKPDASSASSPFQMARKKLVDACIAFSERAVDTGVPMLEDRVRSALVPLRAHLLGLEGRSLELSSLQMEKQHSGVDQILRSAGVAQVFGVPQADAQWPEGSDDPNGAKLVEAVGFALSLPADYKLNSTKFILLQRVAREGALALPLVLTTDPNSETALLALISQCYTWGTSLRDFQQAP